MKFELKPYHRNVPDKDFLDDLGRVASEIQKESLSKDEYDNHGKYHSSTISNRFGSWTKALKVAGLQLRKNPKMGGEELLRDLKHVANILNKESVTQNEYVSMGKYDVSPFIRVFGSWFSALEKAGLERTRTLGVSIDEYFENLEEVWTKLGRQPTSAEMQKPLSKYHRRSYEYRFGSWRKALEAFIEYINDEERNDLNSEQEKENEQLPVQNTMQIKSAQHRTKRNINWRLRFVVMKRDNFKCKICGRSPATDPSIILHVDHIKAWVNGGETSLGNLQTLCSECNIGKSDLE